MRPERGFPLDDGDPAPGVGAVQGERRRQSDDASADDDDVIDPVLLVKSPSSVAGVGRRVIEPRDQLVRP